MRLALYTLLLLFLAQAAIADTEYRMKLLAVQDFGEAYTGSDADLYLELRPGSGRVFLDTFPLTKLDTQISTRFAKEVVCKHFDLDCQKYDFIYTIKANSNIVGGPSAGAAIAALTSIAVLDMKYDPKVAITGTINSGGIIGPVGGVKEKLEAAHAAGLKKVLIAKGNSKIPLNNSNETMDLIEYARQNLSLEVVEVIDIDEALEHLTGRRLAQEEYVVEQNEQYAHIMQGLQQRLCDRGQRIESLIEGSKMVLAEDVLNASQHKKKSAGEAMAEKDYYSSASFCFGRNVLLKGHYYQHKNLTLQAYAALFAQLQDKTLQLGRQLKETPIETISDLQSSMIVKERLSEVDEYIDQFRKEQDLASAHRILAYAEERLYSASSWMDFFAMEGKKFVFSKEALRNSCLQKLSEAQERYQYSQLYLGSLVDKINLKIGSGRAAFIEEDYPLCLMLASQAKADANAVLSSIGLTDESFDEYLSSKNKAVERVIGQNSKEHIFPIMGYSYYQFANSLRSQDKFNSLIYLEYALELSDLSIYFPEQALAPRFDIDVAWKELAFGFIVGVILSSLAFVAYRAWFIKPPKFEWMR